MYLDQIRKSEKLTGSISLTQKVKKLPPTSLKASVVTDSVHMIGQSLLKHMERLRTKAKGVPFSGFRFNYEKVREMRCMKG